MSKICVVGSINMDIVTAVEKYPDRGQTVYGKKIMEFPGGKGANQAISCSRQGKNVILIGCVGKDNNGYRLMEGLEKNNVDTSFIKKLPMINSGQTTIILDDEAENTIIYVEGANRELDSDYVAEKIRELDGCKILLVQMETPGETVLKAMKVAKEKGIFVILDPAPADKVIDAMFLFADLILPNVNETEHLTGIKVTDEATAKNAAKKFKEKGIQQGVLKLGSEGSYIFEDEKITFIEGIKINAVDTVGAGDCFAGALASALLDGQNLVDATSYANVVAALKVTKRGAQSGIPTIEEILSFCEDKKLTTYLLA